MKKLLLLLSGLLLQVASWGQSVELFKKNLEELASERIGGRAYDGGDSLAAAFIAEKFREAGADVSFQKVSFPTNEIVKAFVSVDGVELRPGVDYIINPISGSKKGSYELYYSKDSILKFNEVMNMFKSDGERIAYVRDMGFASYMLMMALPNQKVDLGAFIIANSKELTRKLMRDAGMGDGGYMKDVSPLMYGKSLIGKRLDFPSIMVDKDRFPEDAKEISLDIEMKSDSLYNSSNVIGVIPGAVNPDSVFVFTAHYDHLGRMGDVYFAGANDNASGTSMLISLADYFSKPENKPDNTLVFVAFTGEEMGLLGSREFIRNPPVDLSKIKYVFNFDMVGDRADTLTVYTDSCAIKGFNLIKEINDQQSLFPVVEYKKYEQNSDHFYFLQNRVPAVCIIFDKGDNFNNLHTLNDSIENVDYDSFPKLFDIVTKFVKKY